MQVQNTKLKILDLNELWNIKGSAKETSHSQNPVLHENIHKIPSAIEISVHL